MANPSWAKEEKNKHPAIDQLHQMPQVAGSALPVSCLLTGCHQLAPACLCLVAFSDPRSSLCLHCAGARGNPTHTPGVTAEGSGKLHFLLLPLLIPLGCGDGSVQLTVVPSGPRVRLVLCPFLAASISALCSLPSHINGFPSGHPLRVRSTENPTPAVKITSYRRFSCVGFTNRRSSCHCPNVAGRGINQYVLAPRL